MELTEAIEIIEWLQEERRRDKARLDALEAALERQTAQIAAHQEPLREWENSLTSMSAELRKISELEKRQTQWKDELLDRIEGNRRMQEQAAAELAGSQDRDRQAYLGALGDLRRRIEHLEREASHSDAQVRALVQDREAFLATVAEWHRRLEPLEGMASGLALQIETLKSDRLAYQELFGNLSQRLNSLEEGLKDITSRLTLLAGTHEESVGYIAEQQHAMGELTQQVKALAEKVLFWSTAQEQVTQRLAEQHDGVQTLDQAVRDIRERLAIVVQDLGECRGCFSRLEEDSRQAQIRASGIDERLDLFGQRMDQAASHLVMFDQNFDGLRKSVEESAHAIKMLSGQQDIFVANLTSLGRSYTDLGHQLQEADRSLSLLIQAQGDLQKRSVEQSQTLESFSGELDKLREEIEIVAKGEQRNRSDLAELQKHASKIAQEVGKLAEADAIHGKDLLALSESVTMLQASTQDLAQQSRSYTEQLEVLSAAQPWIRAEVSTLKEALEAASRQVADTRSLLDSWQAKHQSEVAALRTEAEELRRRFADLAERVRLEQLAHRQRLDEWATQMGEWQKDLTSWAAQVRLFQQQSDQARKILLSVQETEKRLRQEYDEAKEKQRVEDARHEKALIAWQQDLEKSWNHFLSEERWRCAKQKELDDSQSARIEALDAWRQSCEASLRAIHQQIEANRQERDERIRDLWRMQAESAKQYIALLQNWIEEARRHGG